MTILRRFCATLVGMVLFLAGLLKLMDPAGASLLVGDYLRFFHLSFLTPASGLFAEVFALLETLLGAALMCGVWKRAVNVICGLMLIFYTLLTAVLWILNPAMDCGCFGEAIHLTHAQSFFKNLVLLALLAIAALPFRAQFKPRIMRLVSFSITSVAVLGFAGWELFHLPLEDFGDYAPGKELMKEGDEHPGGAPLYFYDESGEYCNDILERGWNLVISVHNPERMGRRGWEAVSALCDDMPEGVEPVLLLATVPWRVEELEVPESLRPHVCFADRRQLISFNRSNGGATLIHGGFIAAKWARRDLPSKDELKRLSSGNETEAMMNVTNASRMKLQVFLLGIFAVMLLL